MPDDVYNVDETDLSFSIPPSESLSQGTVTVQSSTIADGSVPMLMALTVSNQ